ncbi:hypothetical protein Tco_0723714 [Tanacetum coccineum]
MEGCPSNLKIPCNIGHVHVEKAYIDLNSPLNIITRMMYNWIMRRKLEDSNRGVRNFTGRIKGMHIFVGNFTYIIDFMIFDEISSIIDPRLSQVVLGRPFVKMSNMTHDPPEGVVRFTNGNDEVAYKMPHKIEQYNSLLNIEKKYTNSVYLRNEEDKRRGVEYVMSKILGFYKECLELGPEYLTRMDDEGEVMLYLMRRSLEVLRKFHWMILGGRFNQFSHVSSPLLSKPVEYKDHLLEDKQIPSVGVFDEGVVKLLVEVLCDNCITSTFEVGQSSRSLLEPQGAERVSTSKQPTLTTWVDPTDGRVYTDIPAYVPPVAPVQAPSSPKWSSGSLSVSPSSSIIVELQCHELRKRNQGFVMFAFVVSSRGELDAWTIWCALESKLTRFHNWISTNGQISLCRKAHLLEDKQIPSVGVFDEGVVKLLIEVPCDNCITSTFEVGQSSRSLLEPQGARGIYGTNSQHLPTWVSIPDGRVYTDIPAYVPPVAPVQAPSSPKWSSSSLTKSLGEAKETLLEEAEPVENSVVREEALKFVVSAQRKEKEEKGLISLGLVPPLSNAELVYTKEKYGDVMFIEIVPKDDASRMEEPKAGEQEVGYFDIFPTKSELAYHKYLMCSLIPSIFLQNPIIMEGCPSNLKIPCNIGHVHVEKAYIDLNSPLNIITRMMYNWIMRRKLEDRNRGMFRNSHRLYLMGKELEVLRSLLDDSWRDDLTSFACRKDHLLEDKQIPSVGVFDEVYSAFGRHLEEIHVTWAHLEKKRTRLRTYTNISQDYVLKGVVKLLVEVPYDNRITSTFEVGQSSRSVPEQQGAKRVSASRQPTLTTWVDLTDGRVYTNIPAYVPPVAPVQTPPSPEWSFGSLPVSPSSLIVP